MILLMPGVNPESVRGSQTGVFIGCNRSEAHEAWGADPQRISGYEMTGCTRAMFANRLSYFFDFKGMYCEKQVTNRLLHVETDRNSVSVSDSAPKPMEKAYLAWFRFR